MSRRGWFLRVITAFACTALAVGAPKAGAASCSTQSQMDAQLRNGLANAARSMATIVQHGEVATLRSQTLPAIASDFNGIASSVTSLAPLVQNATITVDDLYVLDASKDQPGEQRTQFFCGSPIVVLTFNQLPPGMYALAILHATGVPKPQQIAIILANAPGNQWQLAGFYAKPMIEADHDGVWYWVSARRYAEKKANWSAWFYYQIAASLLSPLDFLSSPNLQKLQQEAQHIQPADLPGIKPMLLNAQGATFNVTALNTTTAFGGLDLELHYAPDPAQTSQLRTPVEARKQVTDVMASLLAQHPELRQAFHGIWVHADQGNATLFALELPMNQITATAQPVATNTLQPPTR
jgi:hypothetical protein